MIDASAKMHHCAPAGRSCAAIERQRKGAGLLFAGGAISACPGLEQPARDRDIRRLGVLEAPLPNRLPRRLRVGVGAAAANGYECVGAIDEPHQLQSLQLALEIGDARPQPRPLGAIAGPHHRGRLTRTDGQDLHPANFSGGCSPANNRPSS